MLVHMRKGRDPSGGDWLQILQHFLLYKCCELPFKQQHIVRTLIVAFLKRKELLWKVQADITNPLKGPLNGNKLEDFRENLWFLPICQLL